MTPSEAHPSKAGSAVAVHGGIWGAALAFSTALGLAALLSATVAGRFWRDPPALLTAMITFLPYLYAASASWSFVVWCLVPDRRSPPIALTGTTLVAGLLWGPALRVQPSTGSGGDLKLLSWNVRRLWGGEGSLGRPEEIAAARTCVAGVVEREHPDVLSLLEVSAEDVSWLSEQLGLTCVHGDYRGIQRPDVAGIATCVRTDGPWRLVRGTPQRFVDDEDWYYVFSELEREGALVNVLSVHLYPYSYATSRWRDGVMDVGRRGEAVFRGQGNQSAALLEQVARFEDPTIIAGDFNSTRDMSLHVRLREMFHDAWEHGGDGFGATVRFLGQLPLRIDYVYASPAIAVRNAVVGEDDCSDHRPVLVDFSVAGMDEPTSGVQHTPSR